jgi:hypothetical protein
MPSATPWPAWFAHAVRAGIARPEEFWDLSVREWRALTEESAPRLSRAAFAALAAHYPDGKDG